VSWSRFYLVKARLLATPRRGRLQITSQGREVLKNPPERVDGKFLRRFDEFKAFLASRRQKGGEPSEGTVSSTASSTKTPQEVFEEIYQDMRREVAQQLLDRVKACSPAFFEQLVVELLVAMGYGGTVADAGRAVGKSGDGGIDGIIKEDRLGLDVVYIQAKKWEGTVGRPAVQAFAGSLEGVRAKKGVVITTSRFAASAREYVRQIEKRIILIDGEELAQLLIEHNLGVAKKATYATYRLDEDYFGDGE
jgi:restriction system protein